MDNRLFIFLTIIFLAFGCKTDKLLPSDVGYDYFPVEIGKWVVYDVDSIVFNDFTNEIDSFHFQIKELIESSFVDAEGREVQRLHRYKRKDVGDSWTIKDVWSIVKTNKTAERFEENVMYVKLSFPARIGQSWDGNAANIYDEWMYQCTEYDEEYILGNLLFDSTLTVLQRDENLGIEKDYFIEVYAKHVGLVYKQSIHLEQDFIDPTWSNPRKGFAYTMKGISYGN